jgi:hypothetical protein
LTFLAATFQWDVRTTTTKGDPLDEEQPDEQTVLKKLLPPSRSDNLKLASISVKLCPVDCGSSAPFLAGHDGIARTNGLASIQN